MDRAPVSSITFSQLPDGEFVRIADVDGPCNLGSGLHQRNHAIDQVVDVAERTSLTAISVDADRLATERLDDKIGHDSAVRWVHSRTVGVEDRA